MYQQPRALHVPQKSNTQSRAFMSAFNQSRQVGDDVRSPDLAAFAAPSAVRVYYAQVRLQRSKRIIRNLRPRRGYHRNQRRFTRIRKAHKPYVGQQSQLQPQLPLLAGMPILMLPRSLMPRFREILIPASPAPTLRHQHSLSGCGQICDGFSALPIEYQRSHRYLQKHVFAGMARAIRSFAMASAIRLELAIVAVAQQRVVVRVRFQVNAAAVTAVAARWSAARHKLLSTERNAAVSAVTRFHQNLCFINKHSPYFLSKNDNISIRHWRKSRNLGGH